MFISFIISRTAGTLRFLPSINVKTLKGEENYKKDSDIPDIGLIYQAVLR